MDINNNKVDFGLKEAACGAAGILAAIQLFTSADPVGRSLRLVRQFQHQNRGLTCNTDVDAGIDAYTELHAKKGANERNEQYKSLVNAYYDLATVFYEWGWGSCFHFAYRMEGEASLDASIVRHEHYLGSLLRVLPSSHVIDVGCGIGGPMRNMQRFLRCQITGVTLNPYQVQRGNELTEKAGLSHKCRSVQGDFMKLSDLAADPEKKIPELFDAAYAIEATCHAPDRVACYKEIYKVLKPGAVFACYEWCMTDNYDPTNAEHVKLKQWIEEGDGLPDICSTHDCLKGLKEAGFEVLHERDMVNDKEGVVKPWNLPLTPSWNPLIQRFQFNPVGAFFTNCFVSLLEFCWLAPKGTIKTQRMLQKGGFGLSGGGKLEIFTPMYLMVGRVPLDKKH